MDIATTQNLDSFYRPPAGEIRVAYWTEAPRGQVTRYAHPIAGDDDLSRACALPVTVVAGAQDGPTFLIIAGEHGNEYENIVALQETLAGLDPAELRGRVVAVHCASVDSYLNRTRVAAADGQNLARCYPGNREGTLTERVAYTLQNEFLGQPEPHKPVCLVPLHTYGPGMMGATLSGYNIYRGELELTDAQRRASLATGLPLVWGHEFDPAHAAGAPLGDDASGRTALYAAFLAGIPALYWETTWGSGGEEEYKLGLERLLVHFGMLERTLRSVAPREHIESIGHGAGNMASHNQAPVAGLWRPDVAIWDRVDAGDLLGTLRDLHGDTLAEIRTAREGVVIALPRMQYLAEGAQCGIVV